MGSQVLRGRCPKKTAKLATTASLNKVGSLFNGVAFATSTQVLATMVYRVCYDCYPKRMHSGIDEVPL